MESVEVMLNPPKPWIERYNEFMLRTISWDSVDLAVNMIGTITHEIQATGKATSEQVYVLTSLCELYPRLVCYGKEIT